METLHPSKQLCPSAAGIDTSHSAKMQRLLRLALIFAALLLAGLLYVYVIRTFGIGICCPFERLTGLLCPGCGVSGMMLALFRGDLAAAFACNPVTFCLLPAFAALIGYLAWRYVTHGDQVLPKWMDRTLVGLVVVYAVWGIVRNLM